MKLFEKIKVNAGKTREREIRFLNIPIVQYGKKEENGVQERYLEILPAKSFEHKLLEQILNFTGTDYDNIWILRAGSGESWLLNFAVNSLIKKYKAKKFCFVTSKDRKISVDVLKTCHPNFNFFTIDIPQNVLNTILDKNHFHYKNIFFHIHHCTLKEVETQLMNFQQKRLNENLHTTDFYLNKVGISNFSYCQFTRDIQLEQALEDKIKDLDISNFILLAPEATSVFPVSNNFWETLFIELTKKGYDIFWNCTKKVPKFGKHANISIVEAVMLAQKAKGIIGLRSGFLEPLSILNVPKYVIYTPYKWQNFNTEQTLNYYTLSKYPFVDNKLLYEFDISKSSEEQILTEILRGF